MPGKRIHRIMMISTHGYVAANAEFGKPDTGGQVVFVLELGKSLGRLGYQVDIYTRRFENQPAEEKVAERVRIIRIPCGGPDFIPKEHLCEAIPEWSLNTENYIHKHHLRYEFINSHYWDAGLAGQTLANKLGLPHIHTPHSLGAWKRENMSGTQAELEALYNFQRRIREEKIIYDECDIVVATTPSQRKILTDSYDLAQAKIHVIPPGYDDTRFFPVSTAQRAAIKRENNLEGRIVMAIGRIAANKGYDLLLRAMRHVIQRLPDTRLILAIGSHTPTPGETPLLEELKRLAQELQIAGQVVFSHEWIPDEQLPDYYRAADVFALSSRYEPVGMTAIEAMACGTPTVITTEGGLQELITWGLESIYAPPEDDAAFGMAITAILRDPRIAAQLSRYGSYKARAAFTWMGIAQKTLNILQARPERIRPELVPPAGV